MQDLIFATPWWLLMLLIVGGGYVWYTGNIRSEKSWKIGGITVALLGVALAIISYCVQTDKEYVEQQTRRIVTALDHRDWSALHALLDPQTSLEGVYTNRDQIIDGAKKTTDAIGLTSVSITSMDAKQTDTLITADVTILSSQDITLGRPTITNWRFDWKTPGRAGSWCG